MNNTLRSIIIIIAFCLQFIFVTFDTQPMRSAIYEFWGSQSLYLITISLIQAVPMIVAMFLLFPTRRFGEALGLNKNIPLALIVTLIAMLPMVIGGWMTNGISAPSNYDRFISSTLGAGVFEELPYRAFCFGLLFRFARWGFIPAALFTALLFGAVHLYQSDEFLTALMIFAVTALGNVLFAWLYVEWNYNLWVPIFLHMYMNAFWWIFDLGGNAAGDVWSNILRIASVLLIIFLTVLYKRRKGWKYQVTARTLLVNRSADLA